jgi:hypothetical protein
VRNEAMDKMPTPKMHHYIPQSYLRGFCADDSIVVVDFDGKRVYEAHSQNVAKVKDFYAFVNEQGEDDYRVESEVLQRIDSDGARVIAGIERTQRPPTGEDWAALCAFVVSLELRVPRFRQAGQEIAQFITDVLAQGRLGTRETFEASKQAHEKETGEKLDLEYAEIKRIMDSGGSRVEVPRSEHIQTMLNLMWRIHATAVQMTPHLLFATGRARFITCDSPVHKYDRDESQRRVRGVGWTTRSVEISVPLTRDICLVLDWSERPQIILTRDVGVANANLHRIHTALRYLYSHSRQIAFLASEKQVLWGVNAVFRNFSESKERHAVEITGGLAERRPPERYRR